MISAPIAAATVVFCLLILAVANHQFRAAQRMLKEASEALKSANRRLDQKNS